MAAAGGTGILLVLTLMLVGLSSINRARMAATTAADAAALAAAPVTFLPFGATGSPAEEAARFAALNGADLISCRCPIDGSFAARTVEVRVRWNAQLPLLGSRAIEAVGRAEFRPALLLGSIEFWS